jgi:hypothetical protein
MLFASFIALPAFIAGNVLVPSGAAPTAVVVQHCDFEERYQFESFDCALKLSNFGGQTILISDVDAADSYDSVLPRQISLEPNKSSALTMKVSLGGASGTTSRMVSFTTDEAGTPNVRAYAYGFVNSVLKNPTPAIDFGNVRLSDQQLVGKVVLESIESADFKVTGIVSAPDYVEASVAADGRTVQAKIKPSIPWGLHDSDQIVVSLNSKQQSRAAIRVRIDAIGEISAAESPVALGIVRNDRSRDYFIELKNRSGRDFKVSNVLLEGVAGEAAIADCEPSAKGCKRVRLHIGDGLPIGPIAGIATVDLPEFKQRLPVRFSGTSLPPGLDPITDKDAQEPERTTDVAARNPPADIRSAIRTQVRDSNTPAPSGNGPLLRWSVADEAAVYGYYILRSDTQAGPFEKINKTTIKAEKYEQGIANAYQWRDNSAVPGKTYWYSVGTLYRDGRKEDLTSPQRVVAKPLPESKTH